MQSGAGPRAWSLLSLSDDRRQYPSNSGYPDVLGEKYVYDTAVPNHGSVAVGDLAVIRDDKFVLGMGWIDEIQSEAGRKVRRRCPSCRSTAFKTRLTLSPRFLCTACAAGFDTPFEEMLDVTVLVAEYGRTWHPFQRPVRVAELNGAYVTQAGQHAIRALDYGLAQAILEGLGPVPFWELWPGDGGRSFPGGHVLAVGKVRVGQQRFREEMLDRFGSACAITGPQPAAALEAAHLYRYSLRPEHDVKGGLLLRRDLHALHDSWLLSIDPRTWRVRVAHELLQFPALSALDGQELRVPAHLRPRRSYVEAHWALAQLAGGQSAS